MTPLELGGLDSVLANQLNNQTVQNVQFVSSLSQAIMNIISPNGL